MLVVEDDPSTLKALRRIFALRGWIVLTAETVAEGLRALEVPPDCLLLDLSLPDGEGERVMEAIRERGLEVPTLVVSGVSDAARLTSVEQCYRPEAVFLKPVNLDQLLQVAEPIRLRVACRQAGDAAEVDVS
jgi:DNA-binding response OmpR family regulator